MINKSLCCFLFHPGLKACIQKASGVERRISAAASPTNEFVFVKSDQIFTMEGNIKNTNPNSL
jgi:hypothetical protein